MNFLLILLLQATFIPSIVDVGWAWSHTVVEVAVVETYFDDRPDRLQVYVVNREEGFIHVVGPGAEGWKSTYGTVMSDPIERLGWDDELNTDLFSGLIFESDITPTTKSTICRSENVVYSRGQERVVIPVEAFKHYCANRKMPEY